MKRWVLMLMLSLFVLAMSGVGQAGEVEEITAAQLKAKLDAGQSLVVINSLSPIEYAAGHIPGSINIPFEEMKNTTLLPKDKATPLVFYCMGRK